MTEHMGNHSVSRCNRNPFKREERLSKVPMPGPSSRATEPYSWRWAPGSAFSHIPRRDSDGCECLRTSALGGCENNVAGQDDQHFKHWNGVSDSITWNGRDVLFRETVALVIYVCVLGCYEIYI